MLDERKSENRFDVLAHEAFDFLCSNLHFSCVVSKPDLVRYESLSIFFEAGYSVSYDNEVYVRIGRLGTPGVLSGESAERLDFGLFLKVVDPEGAVAIHNDVPYSIARSEEQVRRALAYFSAGLSRYGLPLLSADSMAYAHARELRFWHAPGFPPSALRANE